MQTLLLPFRRRFLIYTLSIVLTVLFAWLAWTDPSLRWFAILAVLFAGLAALGTADLIPTRHAVLRNYPNAAHLRFLLESIRPEMRQYFFEDEKDGMPFSRDKRALVYQRAKMQLDKRPFGTQYDVYADGYEWLRHSLAPRPHAPDQFRITVGGPDCEKPYSASVFNISAMSFGALSPNAIRALNGGAKKNHFAHDTGEGGFSTYHREMGGDIIWEIGSGYFGCRNADGSFNAEKFAAGAVLDQVKMVELKLSQGAKPGHGGVLPAAKVSEEISRTRGVPMGVDCISPAGHSAFSNPIGLMQMIGEMRRLSGGKPAGFKLCIGHPWEFLAICKAMLQSGIYPDFIVVDGNAGGTGAAGKIATAFDLARAMAIGADWCNSARGFMFSLGCIQSLSYHTDRCPTGVTTQDPTRARALVVPHKTERVYNYHRATLHALAELLAAAGLEHPQQIRSIHFSQRTSTAEVQSFARLYPSLRPGELIDGTSDLRFREAWAMARADTFSAVG